MVYFYCQGIHSSYLIFQAWITVKWKHELHFLTHWSFRWIQWQKIKNQKRIVGWEPQDFLCKRQRWYHCTTETLVTEQILILNLIHYSVIPQILWIHWIHWIQWKPHCYPICQNKVEDEKLDSGFFLTKRCIYFCVTKFLIWVFPLMVVKFIYQIQ